MFAKTFLFNWLHIYSPKICRQGFQWSFLKRVLRQKSKLPTFLQISISFCFRFNSKSSHTNKKPIMPFLGIKRGRVITSLQLCFDINYYPATNQNKYGPETRTFKENIWHYHGFVTYILQWPFRSLTTGLEGRPFCWYGFWWKKGNIKNWKVFLRLDFLCKPENKFLGCWLNSVPKIFEYFSPPVGSSRPKYLP